MSADERNNGVVITAEPTPPACSECGSAGLVGSIITAAQARRCEVLCETGIWRHVRGKAEERMVVIIEMVDGKWRIVE